MMDALRKNKLAFLSLHILFILYLLAIFADFISPYPYDIQHRDTPYHPPTKIHFFDKDGHFHLRPFVYGYKMVDPLNKYYEVDWSKRYPIYFLVEGEPHSILGLYKTDVHLFGVKEGKIFILGADSLGRDIFSRMLYGARISLSIGLIGVFLSFTLGTLIGGISGYFGGRVDNIIMRISEILMSFPSFYLMLALRAIFPIDLSSTEVFLMIVVILSFIGWASLARVVRGMVLSIREMDYVLAAKSYGASSFRIITRHIIPNTYSYLLIAATLSIPGYMLGESALSLLGLGIQEPYASWGNMLASATSYTSVSSYPWILSPGIAIFIAVLAFNILGDALRDALDPKLKRLLR